MQENTELRPNAAAYKALFLKLASDFKIDSALIPEDLNYQNAYQAFYPAMHFFTPGLVINSRLPLFLFFCHNPVTAETLAMYQHEDTVLDNIGNGIVHYAAWSGSVDALDWIKKNDPDLLQKTNDEGYTIAHYAVWSDSVDALDWIQENCPDLLQQKDNEGYTLTYAVAMSGSVDALNWIQQNCLDLLQKTDNEGSTIAHYSAWCGSVDTLNWIQQNDPDLLQQTDNDGYTIAHAVTRSDSVDALNWIQQNCLDLLQKTDNEGSTIAHYAAWSGSLDSLYWIKENDPDLLQKTNDEDYTIAHYAVWSDSVDALDWIQENCPDLLYKTNNDRNTIAHRAGCAGSVDALDWIQENCPDLLQQTNKDGSTIAHFVARSASVAALNWIQQNCLDLLKKTDDTGYTIAHYVARSGSIDTLIWIKKNCPDLFLKLRDDGVSIAHYAALSGNLDCLKEALHLSPEQACTFDISCLEKWGVQPNEKVVITLGSFLETDYTLTQIPGIEALLKDDPRLLLIQFFLERNQAIKQAILTFSPFLQTFTDDPHEPLPEIKIEILKQLLPEGVEVGRVYQSLLPISRAVFILREAIRSLIQWGFSCEDANVSEHMVALDHLIHQLNDTKDGLTVLAQWKTDYQTILATDILIPCRNNSFPFWSDKEPSRKTIQPAVDLVTQILSPKQEAQLQDGEVVELPIATIWR